MLNFTKFIKAIHILLLIPVLGYSQVTEVNKTHDGAFINVTSFDMQTHYYWIPDSSISKLQYGIAKAIEWNKINTQRKMYVNKDIVAFPVMDKQEYLSIGFNPNTSLKGTVRFQGYDDGTSVCYISFNDYGKAVFTNVEFKITFLKCFLNQLQGKSCDSETDKIFH